MKNNKNDKLVFNVGERTLKMNEWMNGKHEKHAKPMFSRTIAKEKHKWKIVFTIYKETKEQKETAQKKNCIINLSQKYFPTNNISQVFRL
jgi:hypothetical protein